MIQFGTYSTVGGADIPFFRKILVIVLSRILEHTNVQNVDVFKVHVFSGIEI